MKKQIVLNYRKSFSHGDTLAFELFENWGPHRLTYLLMLLRATFSEDEMLEPNACILRISDMYCRSIGISSPAKEAENDVTDFNDFLKEANDENAD